MNLEQLPAEPLEREGRASWHTTTPQSDGAEAGRGAGFGPLRAVFSSTGAVYDQE